MTAHKNKARRQERKMMEALDGLGNAKELVVKLFRMLPKTKADRMRGEVEAIAGDLLDEEVSDA